MYPLLGSIPCINSNNLTRKVWKLQMPTASRLAVIGLLSLGALAVVASAIKIVIIVELASVVNCKQAGFTVL
jgi:hypothetical protein